MSCCPLQTHVRTISIASLIVTGISGLVIIILNILFYDDFILATIAETLLFIVHLIIYVMCFIATSKRNKIMLIPFLIITLLHIFFYICLGMYIIYLGSCGIQKLLKLTDNNVFAGLGILVSIFLLLNILAIAMSLHSLMIVARYYRQLEIESESSALPTITFEPCTSNNNVIQDRFVEGEAVVTINIISPSPSIQSQHSQNNH